MNLKIGYVPFNGDPVLVQMAGTVVTNHNSVHKVDRFASDVLKEGDSLEDVYWFQQVYIFAHGAEGEDSVYDCNDNRLRVTALAKQLKDNKLTTAINKVKLWVCSGGAGGAQSTAKLLKNAMVGQGFNKVSVYGYVKTLDSGLHNGHKWGSDYDEDTGVDSNIQRAKELRVKF